MASAPQKTVLLAGFEPFGGESINPSQLAIMRLDKREISGHQVASRVSPCVFGAALEELRIHLRQLRPALVICVGQAGGRAEISLERVAINVDDARVGDNGGHIPIDVPVIENGPAAYFSTLPIKAVVAALQSEAIPAAISNTAGTFVCNHVFYGLMHELQGSKTRGGFIHVPFCLEQAAERENCPAMTLETIERALVIAVEVALGVAEDLRISGGAIH